ncbi:5'-methylthioadenosine/S-adenosylhomocysteine nucleosidase [Sporosarcina sp. SAFN-015]|uniref:5'-methylthioadenosine/S-adenosylhomocysteine nucleosidase n=1 Tax=Sporosarcina sp. SAFN-015 TaxID=3387274 RepID=UPI003F7F53CD
MKIAIIGAMEQEVEILRGKIENPQIETIAGCEFVEGKIGSHDVVLVKSGIGKVNASIATTLLIQSYSPDVVLNTGSAGGFKESLDVGTVVISDEVRHHDVDATAFGYEIGQVPGMPASYPADERLIQIAKEAVEEIGEHEHAVGLIASGDVFMSDAKRVEIVKEQFPAMIAAEMEAAGVAQVCHQFGTPFVVIRALSDIAGKESSISFDEFLPLAAKHSSEIVMHAISKF